MWTDALLAYLHFIAIFVLFAFLTVEVMLVRGALDAAAIRLLGRTDLWYFGSAIAVLVTGLLRLFFGAKAPDFYLGSWPFYAKIALFLVVGVMSVWPTLMFIRWRRHLDQDPIWKLPDEERRRARRFVMIEIHLVALIPAIAVVMARGLAR